MKHKQIDTFVDVDRRSIKETRLLFQYYEMSYGLNVEMHKQVRPILLHSRKDRLFFAQKHRTTSS